MRHPNDEPCPRGNATPDLDPVVAALRDRETFDRTQIAWLMSQAMRWGYDLGYEDGQRDELALAGVAADYAYTGSFNAEVTAREARKRAYRDECDQAARVPRTIDRRAEPPHDMRVAA